MKIIQRYNFGSSLHRPAFHLVGAWIDIVECAPAGDERAVCVTGKHVWFAESVCLNSLIGQKAKHFCHSDICATRSALRPDSLRPFQALRLQLNLLQSDIPQPHRQASRRGHDGRSPQSTLSPLSPSGTRGRSLPSSRITIVSSRYFTPQLPGRPEPRQGHQSRLLARRPSPCASDRGALA